jgi:hypothetical protein
VKRKVTRPARAHNSLGYAELKALAKELRRPVVTLLALSDNNDPFFADRPARRTMAEWAAELYRRLGIERGIHTRGFHYKLISQAEPVSLPSTTVYRNTVNDWHKLKDAARDARYLDLIPNGAGDWVDRKSVHTGHAIEPVGAAVFPTGGGEPDVDMPTPPRLGLARPIAAQPYYVVLACEKSGCDDLLQELGRLYQIDVVVGEGELSTTRCEQLVDRALELGRPCRVLVITDFDPSGQSMPVAWARKIEFALYRRGLRHLDVQVRHIVLTKEQVIEYAIPPVPLKESDLSAAEFVDRHGDSAAELDALRELYPDEFRRILVEEIERYCDPDLETETEQAADDLEQELEDVTEQVHDEHRAALDELTSLWDGTVIPAIEAWQRRAEPIHRAIRAGLSNSAPDPDEHSWPEPAEAAEDDDPLFDSSRDYLTQIAHYKKFQGRSTKRKGAE